MKKQAIKVFLKMVLILLFVPYTGLAKGKAELNANTFLDPSTSYGSYTTQDNLKYIYSIYDEGLVDTKYIYQIDIVGNNYDSNSEYQILFGFDAIEFELYTKNQEMINKY